MTTFIHERMRFIFIHVPKTGGMTVTRFFSHGKSRQWRSEFSLKNEGIGIHDGVPKVYERLGNSIDDYFSFAFYRNTWDWYYSLYRYIVRTPDHPVYPRVKDATFEEFCYQEAERFYRPQKPLVTLDGKVRVTRLVDFRDFGKVFPQILESLGYDAVEIISENRAPNKVNYREAYTPELRDLIGRVYEEDVKFFGFNF